MESLFQVRQCSSVVHMRRGSGLGWIGLDEPSMVVAAAEQGDCQQRDMAGWSDAGFLTDVSHFPSVFSQD